MPFCTNCGTEVGENEKFCSNCGNPLQEDENAVKKSSVQASTPKVTTSSRKTNKFILVIVPVILVVIAAVFFLWSSNNIEFVDKNLEEEGIEALGEDKLLDNDDKKTKTIINESQVLQYIIGTDAAYPPFEKQEGGKVIGFDIDLIKAIAKEAGIEVEIKHTGWDGLFEGIDKGTVDGGISAVTITEKRKETYDFTEPYFEVTQLIMVPKDSNVKTLRI